MTEAPRINTEYTSAGIKKNELTTEPKRIESDVATTVNGGARYL
jgi:hypothetical protein